MEELTALPVERFLDETAARQRTPGGGAVTALTGALACALTRMVAAYSVGKNTEASKRQAVETMSERFARADNLMRALVTEDARAYLAMTDAARALKEAGASGEAKDRYQKAVLAAVAVPMEIAAVASDALATMDEFKSSAGKYLISDLGVAAVLAQGAARAARYMVLVNVGQLDDAGMRSKLAGSMEEIVRHCDTRLASIEGFVRQHLEMTAAGGR